MQMKGKSLSVTSSRSFHRGHSQGSSAPFTIKSSIITPKNPSALVTMRGGTRKVGNSALMPAIMPCAAASSYPVVPNEMVQHGDL
jgi:hypothetical protein